MVVCFEYNDVFMAVVDVLIGVACGVVVPFCTSILVVCFEYNDVDIVVVVVLIGVAGDVVEPF